MKLLDKKAVTATLQTERKQQIDSGVKIAEKVDALRETMLTEEKRLGDFRRESVATVQADIEIKIRERDGIQDEMARRRSELVELNKPLDHAWEEVEKWKHWYEQKKTYIHQQQATMVRERNQLTDDTRENSAETQRISTLKADALEDRETALNAKNEAIQHLLKARAEATTILSGAKEREEALELREKDLDTERSALDAQAKRLKLLEKDISNREKALKDKQETLLRTQNRLKK